MEKSARFASFYGRVEFERAVLRAANTIVGATSQLHGLTPEARASWLREMDQPIHASALPRLLERCWEELGKMSDHSRNVFEIRPDRPDLRVDLLEAIRLFADARK